MLCSWSERLLQCTDLYGYSVSDLSPDCLATCTSLTTRTLESECLVLAVTSYTPFSVMVM